MREHAEANYTDYSEVRKGKKVMCPTCKKGYFVTNYKDVTRSPFFYCNNCGEKLLFNIGIDLSDI